MLEDSRAFFLPKSNPLRRALIWKKKNEIVKSLPGYPAGFFKRGTGLGTEKQEKIFC